MNRRPRPDPITTLSEDAVGPLSLHLSPESSWSALRGPEPGGIAEAASALPAGVPGPCCPPPTGPHPRPRSPLLLSSLPMPPLPPAWLSSLSLVSPGKSQGPGDPDQSWMVLQGLQGEATSSPGCHPVSWSQAGPEHSDPPPPEKVTMKSLGSDVDTALGGAEGGDPSMMERGLHLVWPCSPFQESGVVPG